MKDTVGLAGLACYVIVHNASRRRRRKRRRIDAVFKQDTATRTIASTKGLYQKVIKVRIKTNTARRLTSRGQQRLMF